MNAILATSGAIRTLVDGTLRISFDVEPKDAADAFAMFGKPGSPAALARIMNEAAVEHDRKAQAQPPAEPLERKPMALSSKVALACQSPTFQAFLRSARRPGWTEMHALLGEETGDAPTNEWITVALVRRICRVQSRSEIIPGTEAGRLWSDLEAQYHDWQRTGSAA